jgi:hypothetical protein
VWQFKRVGGIKPIKRQARLDYASPRHRDIDDRAKQQPYQYAKTSAAHTQTTSMCPRHCVAGRCMATQIANPDDNIASLSRRIHLRKP